MIPSYYLHDNWFDWASKNYLDLNILCEKQLIKHPRPFAGISKDYSCWYWYFWWWTEQFLEQIVQISNKSKLLKTKEWNHMSFTSIISAKTWSNWTFWGCFEIFRTSRFQNLHCFWNLSKICESNRAKQNTKNLRSQLYFILVYLCERMNTISKVFVGA